jgi:membrane-associated phospholipid phosphatase
MNRYRSLLIIFLVLFSGISYSYCYIISPADSLNNHSGSSSPIEIFKYDVKKSLNDGLDILKAPAHFSSGDWITLGAIAGGTSLSMLLDNDIRNVVRRNRTQTMDNVTKIGQYYGEVVPAVSLSAGLYAAGLIFKERSVSLTGRLLAESLVYAGTINILLKYLFSRSRPYTNNGNTDFWNYKFNNDFYSMPSGHTTVAFTLSTVLAERINNIYATIGLYTLAAFTAYQRIYSDNHWFSDTLLGAAIGIVIGRAVVNLNKDDPYQPEDFNISGTPLMLKQGFGFSFGFSF